MMENGVRVVEGNGVEDGVVAKEKVLGPRVEEQAVSDSYDSKESGGDEYFEEAVEVETPRVISEEGVSGNVEKLGDSASGFEVEKFDEAVGIPDALLNDESSNHDETTGSQLDRLLDDRIEVEVESKSPGNAEAEMARYEDGDMTISAAVQSSEKAENGFPDHNSSITYDEAVVDSLEDQGHGPLGSMDISDTKGGDTGLHLKAEPNGFTAHQDESDLEVFDESGGLMDSGHSDEHVELQNTSTSSSFGLQVEDQGEISTTAVTNMEENELLCQERRMQEDDGDVGAIPLDNPSDNGRINISSVDMPVGNSKVSHLNSSEVSFLGSEPLTDTEEKDDKNEQLGQNVSASREVFVAETADSSPSESNGAVSEVFKFVVYEHDNKEGEVSQPTLQKVDERDVQQITGTSASSENKDGDANQPILQNGDARDVQQTAGTLASSETSATPTQLAQPPPPSLGTKVPESIQENRETLTGASSSLFVQSTASVPDPPRPAGLGRAAPLLEPAPRSVQQSRVNGTVSPVQDQLVENSTNGDGEETDETREKLQMIRVKFLRLAHRLGQTPHNVVVAQVLYRLGLAEQLRGRNGGRGAAFSFDRASAMAEQLEAAGQEPLDFSCTIMVIGKSGVGKSATINSIFDEIKFGTDAFQLGTKKVQDVVGTVQGIKVRVIDTPGLLPSWLDQRKNEKILRSIKQFIKRMPPDIVLYLDRLDVPSREFGDMPLLKTITEIFGPSVWFNAIVVLTHAASAPPEGPNGTATSYDMFVSQRSQVVQQAIRQAAGDMRLMNPVSLVENHSACRTNRAGQRVLPNGQVWKPHLLLLSFASKILAEANTLLKLQDSPPGRVLASRTRSPPLPFLLSSLLQSRQPVKLPMEQFGDDDDALDDELTDSSDSDDEVEFDDLPPFKRLTKAQLAELPKDQRKAYHMELEYRERLFMKKQLKEEKKRRKMMRKMQAAAHDLPPDYQDSEEKESGGEGSVPVPMPDLALPASFDSDNPTHRYRYLDSSNQWLVRPVLDTHGWDHDVGYEGINLERLFVVKDKIPVSFSGQISKDKKDTNLQMEIASTVKHSEGKATSLGCDLQSVGKDIAYTLRSETRFWNWKKNKAVAGLSATLLGDVLTGGLKIEDKLIVNKQAQCVMSAGAMFGRGDVAYGGSLEATLRDKDHPVGRFLSTLGVSVMDWRGDLAIGWTCQCQVPIGQATNLIGRVNVNNRGSGQVSIRANSSEHLQIALLSLVPLFRKILSDFQRVEFG